MHLPESTQHFPNPTLIISADSVHARFFLVGGDSLEELDGVAVTRELLSDREGAFTSFDGSRVGGPASDIDDEPRLKKFVRSMSDTATELVRAHNIAHIHLVMPAEIEHHLSKILPADSAKLIGQTLHLDLMKEPPIEIVERLLKSWV